MNNLNAEAIVKLSPSEQIPALSHICSDDVFLVAEALGNKDVTWEIGNEVEAVVEGNTYTYIWTFPNTDDDAIATSFVMTPVKPKDCLHPDIDIDSLNVMFEEVKEEPFAFTADGIPNQCKQDFSVSFIYGNITYKNETIGTIHLVKVRNDIEFYDACDDLSGDLETIAGEICDNSGRVSKTYSKKDKYVILVDKISINKTFRSKGIGSLIMSTLQIMMSWQFDIETIFLVAGAYELNHEETREKFKSQNERLVNFYSRCGFKHINNRVMYIN